jgi:hypothetical protein
MLGGNNVDHRFGISQLSTPYNITTVSSTTVYDLADDFSYTDESNYWVHASNYSSDGKKLIISSVYGYDLIYIQLSTAFDPSSNTSTNTYSSDSISDLYFISDGSKAISQRNASNVRIYNTGTPASDVVPGTYFDFNGTDDYVQVTGSITVTSATFITWIKRDGNQTSWTGLIHSRGGTNGDVVGLHFNQGGTKIAYTWNDASNTYQWNSNLLIPNDQWCMVALSVNSTSATAYLCQSSGITSKTNTVSHPSQTLADILVGKDDQNNDREYDGNMAIAQIYNRALTAAEVEQNFNATKGRYM